MRVWIDLENTPHAVFFPPLVAALTARGHDVEITARDFGQTRELLELAGIEYRAVGGGLRGPKWVKASGVLARAGRLAAGRFGRAGDVAVNHCSRSQILAAKVLGVPVVTMLDYEHAATGLATRLSTKLLVPEALAATGMRTKLGRGVRFGGYPGIKEELYMRPLPPDRHAREQLGADAGDVLVLVRPPATRAHYHSETSDRVFGEVMRHLAESPAPVRVVLLPRYPEQADDLRRGAGGAVSVLERPLPVATLLGAADLVLSGGGTMVREAVAAGVPAVSIFGGRLGVCDRSLVEAGRLTHLGPGESARLAPLLVRRGAPPEDATRGTILEFLVREIEHPTEPVALL